MQPGENDNKLSSDQKLPPKMAFISSVLGGRDGVVAKFFSSHKHAWGWPLLVLVLVIAIGLYLVITEPSSPPLNVFISNLSDHKATISWTTQIPTRGAVIVSRDNTFPWIAILLPGILEKLPFFNSPLIKDDSEKNSLEFNHFTTHHVTVSNLDPNQTYQYRIYQGWRQVDQGSLVTAPTLSTLATPNPVYGRVVAADRITPVVGAIVYLTLSDGPASSALMSTLTNNQGGWSIDLSNLRASDLQANYQVKRSTAVKSAKSGTQIATGSAEMVVVEAGAAGRVKATSVPGSDKPWPDILMVPVK